MNTLITIVLCRNCGHDPHPEGNCPIYHEWDMEKYPCGCTHSEPALAPFVNAKPVFMKEAKKTKTDLLLTLVYLGLLLGLVLYALGVWKP